MVHTGNLLATLSALGYALASEAMLETRQNDPCAKIGGQQWVNPADLRACFTSFPLDPALQENIIDVLNKTMAFHVSVNYQISAPEPFTNDVHEDLLKDFARIKAQSYDSEYDMHVDIQNSINRLRDGHCFWSYNCFDCAFVYTNFLPIFLVQIVDASGTQTVNIAAESYNVSSVEFADQIDVWEAALPDGITLESLNGATVLSIDGKDPLIAADTNAETNGHLQGLGTRQNVFFASYQRGQTGWNYVLGDFAQQSLPRSDSVTLEIQRVNQPKTETVTIPYRARRGINPANLTDTASWRAGFCLNPTSDTFIKSYPDTKITREITKKFQQQSPMPPASFRDIVSAVPNDLTDAAFPPSLAPPAQNLPGEFGFGEFFMLEDGVTGVLAFGSFAGDTLEAQERGLLDGLNGLKSKGAKQLIVDVTNNGGGSVCIAHFLHRILVGPKDTTVPQAILDTKIRAGPLAKLIVKAIIENNTDPDVQALFNPARWTNASDVPFAPNFDFMDPAVDEVINGVPDAFSQRIGAECPDSGGWDVELPDEPLFEGPNVVIVSNGLCASSCGLFSIPMVKREGARTVVVGGRQGVNQQYTGTVGGQSLNGFNMFAEALNAGLVDNPLNQPILLVQGLIGITWRSAFGIDDPTQPEEWQDHSADLNLPLTAETVNNPLAIWNEVAKRMFS
ncbi:hypothetical protein D9758_003451 [Tetrapyrgos nigripes]|uniref:Tail specific protease domain-containing protein n=1 Tax=Tetrapyrgos nigripes TaxID=182062 RepID=A0A8H5LW30_9AGAR|nr:hypothetical protein D9758_003451 [Tetrapyrgos nigripes]